MELIDIITGPVVGAVIGYFTNWLAIKMLFRPHEEKHLFGLKVPLTPGLIPKERFVLSKKIGEITAKNVLTEEVLLDYLRKPEVVEGVRTIVLDMLNKAEQSEKSVGEVLALAAGGNYRIEDVNSKMEALIIKAATSALDNPSFNAAASEQLTKYVTDFLRQPGDYLPIEQAYAKLREYVLDEGGKWLESGGQRNLVAGAVSGLRDSLQNSDRTIGEIIPESLVNDILSWVDNNAERLPSLLGKFLEDNPALEERLTKIVADIAKEQLGSFIGFFVNYDKIYGKIKRSVLSYLEDNDNIELLRNKLHELAASLEQRTLRSLADLITDERADALTDFADAAVGKAIKENLLQKLVGIVDEKKDKLLPLDIYQMALKHEPDFDIKLRAFIDERIIPSARAAIESHIPAVAQKITLRVSEAKAGDILKGISGSWHEALAERLLSFVEVAVEKGAGFLIHSLNISEIIETKINQFSVEEAEELILSVVNRELQMITILGGVLGLIIGCVPLIVGLIR